jgi:PAS domain S-box-containing protein
MWLYDAGSLRFLEVNDAAVSLYGYTRDEFLQKRITDLRSAEDAERLVRDLRQAPPGLRRWADIRHRTRDGRVLDVEIAAHTLEFRGTPAVFVVAHDVTGRKNAERALRSLNLELEQRVSQRTAELQAVVDELEAFSYSVSHDLRAPLRSIDGFTHALIESSNEKLEPVAREYLQRVRAASQRMGQLIDDLLHLSRVGRREMHVQEVNVSDLAVTVSRDLQNSDSKRRIEVVITPELYGRGDERLLKIVLENLLGNAWKFTSKTPRARIEFGRETKDNREAFYVRDNGAGFDMTYADKLFMPFARLHSAQEFPGSGIGLSVVQRIINRHGGRLWAEGKPGGGATVWFALPD